LPFDVFSKLERDCRLVESEELERRESNYRIDIGAYGSIVIEAPTKKECLELFREVTSTKRKQSID
jgi:hypothetical protein